MIKGKGLCSFIGIFILLISLFPVNSIAQGNWEKLTVPVTVVLRSVCFTDSLHGWVAGDSGTILHTSDGSSHWVLQNSNLLSDITSIFFLDSMQGWASALNYAVPPYGSLILKTADGGTTWSTTAWPQENIFINCIWFSDSLHGWMGGSPHALVSTSDGGISWKQATVDSSILGNFPVLGIKFYNARHGYASGGMFDIAGVIWSTHDSGNTWQVISVGDAPADEIRGLHCYDSMRVIGAGGDPDFGYGVAMIRTVDGGINWNYDELGIQGTTYDIDFRTPAEAWAPLGPKQTLIFSLDSGVTWTEIATPDNSVITSITFPDSLHGYAVGREGTILRYIPPFHPGTGPATIRNHEISMKCFYQGAGRGCCIEVTSEKAGMGLLTLTDLSGRTIWSMSERALSPGVHRFSTGPLDVGKGLYICRFRFFRNNVGDAGRTTDLTGRLLIF